MYGKSDVNTLLDIFNNEQLIDDKEYVSDTITVDRRIGKYDWI